MATSNDSTTYVGEYNTTAASNVPPDSGATGKRFQGAAEIRQIKKVLKDSFPSVTGAVTATHTELNQLDGITVVSTSGTQTLSNKTFASPFNVFDDTAAADQYLGVGSSGNNEAGYRFTRSGNVDAYIVMDSSEQMIFAIDDGNTLANSKYIFKTDGTEKVRIETDGDVGIGTSSPSCKLDVAGYTKLGDSANAPQIKTMYLTGTTAASGSTTTITTGLTQAQILSVDVLVISDSGNLHHESAGDPNDFTWIVNSSGNVVISSTTSTSASIDGNSCRVFIVYKAA